MSLTTPAADAPPGPGEPARPDPADAPPHQAEPPPDPAEPVEAPHQAEAPDPIEPVEAPPDPVRQLSLFGVEATEPSAADLAGLLAGPGQVVRMGGTARVSVLVDAAWRVHVLAAELAVRGLAASWEATAEQRHLVRTSYTTGLAPLARGWLRAATKRPPPDFHLNGRRLRLWVAAAGLPEPAGFLLQLDPVDELCWPAVGAALAAIGLPASLLAEQPGGPAYRITGRRRLRRLVELVGERPAAAPAGCWPVSG